MAHLVEILLPLSDAPMQQALEDIRNELTARFGGATLHINAPAEGAWADNGTLELDRIVIAEVMTEGLDRDWWRDYRERLERQLAQDEIVIRATQIDRL
ncbi:hypothetical protein DEM27_28135 [Metarhizobium album]|uniref:Uncharacterized protein n=1 Tax=Metarhizobium album TaxID=2182425 RepID=A0A2U2DI29_9HYPH|nr:hypothetical protein [Rhizobium album]PWE52959.1 hypothetical protein DEM27_28135 [Rhizobium album]